MSDWDRSGDGDCYEIAARIIAEMDDASGAMLWHGIVVGQGPVAGIRFGHAWVEVNGFAIDGSNGRSIIIPAERYREVGQITDDRCYSPGEARRLMIETEHFGPWHRAIEEGDG